MKFRPQDGVWQPAPRIQQGLVLWKHCLIVQAVQCVHGEDDDIIQNDGVDHIAQAVHGPYDPAVFYGKKDLPLREVNLFIEINQTIIIQMLKNCRWRFNWIESKLATKLQVKVYQLPAWLLRRQFYNPIAYGRALSRFNLMKVTSIWWCTRRLSSPTKVGHNLHSCNTLAP